MGLYTETSCRFLLKVPVDQDQRSHQCPHIEGDTDPTGGDLHPHRRPPAGHGFVVGVGAAKTIGNKCMSKIIS